MPDHEFLFALRLHPDGRFEEMLRGASARGGFDGGAGREFAMPGEDIEGDILVTLDEVMHGSVRSISLEKVNPRTGQAETHAFKVRIPAGVPSGARLRVAGKGNSGLLGGPAGDLYITVRVEPHPFFRRDGDDIAKN